MKQLKSGDWILALALTIVAYIYYDALSHSPRINGIVAINCGEVPCLDFDDAPFTDESLK